MSIIKKNYTEFHIIPSIRLTLSSFVGNFYKGRNLNNGFRYLTFSLKFLNFMFIKEKKLKTK